ncbi:hypothetical protein PCANC_15823 [Puccinia coronata f. sp. avenae]|uniref:Autophagy-related protein 101 n=2 Tax=Puccinia coronata f. sp. avenae TaxID=200324 RepID=A0A2N5UDZ0_9BASI|nr:hypothetical protein PCANC_15823 [Puccinia coronata f. sp. avenae]
MKGAKVLAPQNCQGTTTNHSHLSMMINRQRHSIPVFRHEFVMTKNFPREIVRTVLHAILFHRVFGSVEPKEVEVLGVTFPQVVESEIESLVNERTDQVVTALEHQTPTVLLSIRFLETRLSKPATRDDDKSWFKSSTATSSSNNTNQDGENDNDDGGGGGGGDSLAWEKWEISFKMHSTPHSYSSSSSSHRYPSLLLNPIGYLSSKSDKSSEHPESLKSIQSQLDQFLRRLIDFVLHERDHVPAITTSDLLPFPVDITIIPRMQR